MAPPGFEIVSEPLAEAPSLADRLRMPGVALKPGAGTTPEPLRENVR